MSQKNDEDNEWRRKKDTFYCSSHFLKWENVINSVGLLENYAVLRDNRHEHSWCLFFGFILMSFCSIVEFCSDSLFIVCNSWEKSVIR